MSWRRRFVVNQIISKTVVDRCAFPHVSFHFFISKYFRKISLQLATGTVASVPYALPMKVEDLVPITLRCFRCLAEREIRTPRERGLAPGKYLWECLECQRRRISWSSNEPMEGEGR
jgi:hypothetical protein